MLVEDTPRLPDEGPPSQRVPAALLYLVSRGIVAIIFPAIRVRDPHPVTTAAFVAASVAFLVRHLSGVWANRRDDRVAVAVLVGLIALVAFDGGQLLTTAVHHPL